MKKSIIILFFAGIAFAGYAQKKAEPKWQDFSKTVNATEQEKISMIYVYNTPCDLCTTTEETILADSTVIKALMKDFISAKFDAGTKDDVVVKEQKYPYSSFTEESGVNIYAIVLLNGKMGYPTFAFLDKEGEKIGTHFPVKDAEEFLQILKYYSSGDYKETPYEAWINK
jgi:thioredoxin-related protein